jgi:hypothetical protein
MYSGIIPHADSPSGFNSGIHMCLIYDETEERDSTISQFLANSLRSGAHSSYFSVGTAKAAILGRLRELGLSDTLLNESNLDIQPASSVYCPNGHFDRQDMIARLKSTYHRHCCGGSRPVFVTGEMEWALASGENVTDELIRYEGDVTTAIADNPLSAVCQYDSRLFDAATLMGILQAHPFVLLAGQAVANPLYRRASQ